LLVQRKKPKKARPGWRDLSRYASGSAGKPGAHIPVRPFALPLAALTPRLRGFGSRAAPTRHPVAAGQAQTSLSAPLRALAQSLAGLGCAIRGFENTSAWRLEVGCSHPRRSEPSTERGRESSRDS
jgi:hypothetical protein